MSKLDTLLDEFGEELIETVGEFDGDVLAMLKEIQEVGRTRKQQIKELFLELIGYDYEDRPQGVDRTCYRLTKCELRKKVEKL